MCTNPYMSTHVHTHAYMNTYHIFLFFPFLPFFCPSFLPSFSTSFFPTYLCLLSVYKDHEFILIPLIDIQHNRVYSDLCPFFSPIFPLKWVITICIIFSYFFTLINTHKIISEISKSYTYWAEALLLTKIHLSFALQYQSKIMFSMLIILVFYFSPQLSVNVIHLYCTYIYLLYLFSIFGSYILVILFCILCFGSTGVW
jgi:hypothetical protein